MRKLGVLLVVLFLFSIFFEGELFAIHGDREKWKTKGGWGMGTSYSKLYDPKTVETISGEVVSVDKIIPMPGMSYGVQLTVKTEKETIPVQLGPEAYVENQPIKIGQKDKIVVKGSRVTVEGKPAVIAAEIKKGDQTLKLRDENGVPEWK